MRLREALRFTVVCITCISAVSAAPAASPHSSWPDRIAELPKGPQGAASAFKLGLEMAEAPGREGIDALKATWPSLPAAAKQQFIKAWHFAPPAPYRVRLHPHIFELFELALSNAEPTVHEWVLDYLTSYAWAPMKSVEEANAWLARHRDGSPEAAASVGLAMWRKRLDDEADAVVAMNLLPKVGYPLRRNQVLVEIARGLQLQPALERMIERPGVSIDAIDAAYAMLSELDTQKYPADGREAFLKRLEAKADPDAAPRQAFDIRTIDGDERRKWVLHPPLAGVKPDAPENPAAGLGLLVVLPGGDGAIGFAPFVADTIRPAAGDDYVVIQMVAPPIADGNEDAVIWPTESLRDGRVDFTMEPLILKAIESVRKGYTISPDRIFIMGWSSGGPPSYAMTLKEGSPIRGALVAMSVFRPDQYPGLGDGPAAKGKSFFLLHSPQDFIPMRFPEEAKRTLEAAGGRVALERYEGGHGWQGDSMKRIGEAMRWLEKTETPNPDNR
jgi:predicted esterase